MKKISVFTLALFAVWSFAFGNVVRAQSNSIFQNLDCSGVDATNPVCSDADTGKTQNKLYGKDGVLTKAASFLALITGIIGLIMIVLAGLSFVNSGGDSARVASARNRIIYALVGLAIAGSAQAIATFILSRLK